LHNSAAKCLTRIIFGLCFYRALKMNILHGRIII
jgi:hypothetical protein